MSGSKPNKKKQGIEDSDDWPESLVLNIRCTTCNDFMDEPHCDKGGCPWCFKCGPNSVKDI